MGQGGTGKVLPNGILAGDSLSVAPELPPRRACRRFSSAWSVPLAPAWGRPGRHSPLAVLQDDCGSPVWSAGGSSFDAIYCSEMAHGKPDSLRPWAWRVEAGAGRAALIIAALEEGSARPRCNALPPALPQPQGMQPSRAAPCPAWTVSPASWTASPRRRSRGCPSAKPTPSRRAPASTRGRERPGRLLPDEPTRLYERPRGAGTQLLLLPPRTLPSPRGRLPRPAASCKRFSGEWGSPSAAPAPLVPPPPSGAGGKAPLRVPARDPPGADRPWGSAHTRYPRNLAANKTCCKRVVWPDVF